tara:strand:+ start:77 stop:325 length:249 start_codon:yes stop_codon:yes gene_type:complete
MEDKKEIGKITHFFPKINVAIVELTEPLSVGDKIWINGAETVLEQTIESMQIEHQNIQKAEKGQAIGLKVIEKVRAHDRLYK